MADRVLQGSRANGECGSAPGRHRRVPASGGRTLLNAAARDRVNRVSVSIVSKLMNRKKEAAQPHLICKNYHMMVSQFAYLRNQVRSAQLNMYISMDSY
jgi:hypothetical protein